MSFASLLAEHLVVSLEKQTVLTDLVGERDWAADLAEGVLTFGDDIVARTEVLGSEDEERGTWLWAWANSSPDVPDHLLAASHLARQEGARLGIPELREPSFRLHGMRNGHAVGLACIGLLGLPAYYSGPAGGGVRVILVVHHPELVLPPPSALRATTGFSTAIGMFQLDHRAMVEGFARQRGVPFTSKGRDLFLDFPDGRLHVTLDRRGQLEDMKAELSPSGDPP